MVSSRPCPHQPWWRQALTTAIELVAAPGWAGTLKVVFLAVVAALIYAGLHLLLR
jgi:hypothetical protein